MEILEGLTRRNTPIKYHMKYHVLGEDGKHIEICHGTLLVHHREEIGDNPAGILEDIWTHENYRKQGLASKLIKQLIEEAKRDKCYKVVLHCADHNIAFYKKLGFDIWQNGMRLNLT